MTVQPAFQRLALLTGAEAIAALSRARVIVFGLGGVGSWCAEALARSALGHITIVDSDMVCVTNINRQAEASAATVGELKTGAMAKRLLEINPALDLKALPRVFSGETAGDFGIEEADYVIDAIDSLGPKLDLIEYCARAGVTLYSSMGMAQKLDPTRLRVTDIWESQGCPLARLVRQGLRKRGFAGHFAALWSGEKLPLAGDAAVSCGSSGGENCCLCPARNRDDPASPVEWCSGKKVINGSAVTVTATAGMILAGLVVQDIYRGFGWNADSAQIPDSTRSADAAPEGEADAVLSCG